MLVERAELEITEGREEEFAQAMSSAIQVLLDDQDGARELVHFGRGVENPSKFLLVLRWDSPEHHMQFRDTEAFVEFANAVRSFYAAPPFMEHFQF